MSHIMIDLETMSTKPNAAIVAIGAVEFSKEGLGREFYVTVTLSSNEEYGRHVSASTIMWWLEQSNEARKELTNAKVGLQEALELFSVFVRSVKPTGVWGNGAGFDNVVLREAYSAVFTENSEPWPFYADRCYRTIRNLTDHRAVKFDGEKHNALSDAKHQAKIMLSKEIICHL